MFLYLIVFSNEITNNSINNENQSNSNSLIAPDTPKLISTNNNNNNNNSDFFYYNNNDYIEISNLVPTINSSYFYQDSLPITPQYTGFESMKNFVSTFFVSLFNFYS